MKIKIQHFAGQYPSFNVALHANDAAEAFLIIKGCGIGTGANGEFVRWPSRKKEDGTWWNHCRASDAFNAAVLREAKSTAPPPPPPREDLDDFPF